MNTQKGYALIFALALLAGAALVAVTWAAPRADLRGARTHHRWQALHRPVQEPRAAWRL